MPYLAEVKRAWETVFPGRSLEAEDHFFRLGGDSLAAVGMILDVENRTGLHIPLGTVYRDPTLGGFVEALSSLPRDPKRPVVIPLRMSGTRRPLFVLAPAKGGVFHYRCLASHLEEGHPCVCIEPRISARGKHEYESLEELASYNVAAMRTVQPTGPYILCGFSFGGSIGWEMARQLHAGGEEVAALILLDTLAQGKDAGDALPDAGAVRQLVHHLLRMPHYLEVHRRHGARINLPGIGAIVRRRFSSVLLRLTGARPSRGAMGLAAEKEKAPAEDYDELALHKFLRRDYTYGSLECPVHLIRCAEQMRVCRVLDYALGWDGHTSGPFRVILVPGHHHSMMREGHVGRVAAEIADILQQGAAPKSARTEEQLPAVPYPMESVTTPLERFFVIANAFRNRPAVHDGQREIVYTRLAQMTDTLAAHFGRIGVGPHEGVVLFIGAGADFIIGFLGILKSGNYYVPLDPELPGERLRCILEDCGAHAILTLKKHREHLERALAGRDLILVEIDALDLDRPAPPPAVAVEPSDRCVILYTSGSTGTPKGVVHTHLSVADIARRRLTGLGLGPEDRYLSPYSPGFMGAMTGMYGTLLSGGCLFPYDVKANGIAGIPVWINAHRITVFHGVTSIYRRIVGSLEEGANFPTLRKIIPGGEASRRSDIEQFKRVFTRGVTYYTNLGSSECGTIVLHPITHDTEVGGRVPNGVPFPDLNLRAVNEAGETLLPGVEGEIVLESDRIFLEYLNSPEKTAAAMTTLENGKRLFRTGDFGFFDECGILYLTGRRDSMVKIHGFRVDVLEVETVLMRLEGIEEVAVAARSEGDGNQRLFAFFRTRESGRPWTENGIREELMRVLPMPAIPEVYLRVSRMPSTVNGKLDRKQLAAAPLESMDFVVRDSVDHPESAG